MKAGSIVLHGHEGKTYYGKEIRIHDDYHSLTKENDIALLRVKPNIEFSDKVSSVKVPTDDAVEEGDRAVFPGWGRLKVSELNLQ